MITTENLKALLTLLQFEEDKNVYSKHFPDGDFYLKVDFFKQELIYPSALTVHERHTCSFNSPENFVVFECVHRLLAKGYKPEHIELEPKWKLGHGASGGRADILVCNQDGAPILIIECKTAGREFDRAWKDTRNNGGQILTYADRERTVKFVCLYTSDLDKESLDYENYIITLSDIPNLIEQYAGKDIQPLFYKDVTDVKQWYQVWKETYHFDYQTQGIFEPEVQAYNIGQQKLRLKDLRYITGREMQSKFNEFAEILRKHNVSSKEGAFDKLINLFLCKIVDEYQAHYNNKDLEFHWRGQYADDYFSLIDRLQRLYKEGMETYIGEKITYIDNKAVADAFGFYHDRNATRDYVLRLFKQQKYFTNSDFGFIDVHNDKLFYQNALILLDVVKMWQSYQLNGEQQNQFLSDMFEGFLDKGFKQSEGQFFTPIPICKFILSALPIEKIVNEREKPPRVIDYACGSGHFLTEYAAQVRPLIEAQNQAIENPEQHKDLKAYYANTFGVEKEYRLSKVAKMSAFMYGQDEINVIYCDALKNIQQEIHGKIVLVEEESCDILVANPPFAVDGFLTTLSQEEREKYMLFDKHIDIQTQRNIQCFFLERAKHLLAPNGVLGVIVPSSVLSNSDTMHIATREILLQYFDFVSIVELGKNTFGKTGTNTVVLFLRRKAQRPEPAEQYWNRTLDFFDNWEKELATNGGKYNDLHLVRRYAQYIDIPFDHYQSLLFGAPSPELLQTELFRDYRTDFDSLTEIQKLKEAKQHKAKTAAEQQAELDKRLLKHLQTIEQQKLYCFMLAYSNPQKVLLVKSPTDDKEQKQFLGYEWSTAKRNEGIKYHGGDTVHDIITPMFDPRNRNNPDKISFYIQQNFLAHTQSIVVARSETEETTTEEAILPKHLNDIPEHLQPFLQLCTLTELLKFNNKSFDKSISLSSQKARTIESVSKYTLVRLGEVCNIVIGGTPSRQNSDYFKGSHLWVSVAELNGQIIADTKEKITDEGVQKSNVKLIPKGTTLLSFKLSIGKTAIAGTDLYTNEAIAGLIPKDKNALLDVFLFHLFSVKQIDLSTNNNAIGQSLNSKYLRDELKIPLPPLTVQQQIVQECEAIDQAVSKGQNAIVVAKKEIEERVREVVNNPSFEEIKIGNLTETSSGGTPLSTNKAFYTNGTIPWVNSGEVAQGEIWKAENFITELGLQNSNAKIFPKETVLLAMYGATAGKVGILKIEATTNQAICGILPNERYLPKFLFLQLQTMYDYLLSLRTGIARDNLSQNKIKEIKVKLPPLTEQQALVAAIEVLEASIAAAQKVMNEAAAQKQAVMKLYL